MTVSSAELNRVQLLLMADDLTGTADSAIGCAQAGLATTVILGANHTEYSDAVAIDLDSRNESTAEAARRHSRALATWQGRFRFLFKKIDSTLRGNVAAEIASLSSIGMAIIAPAYPATGRTTIGGRQYLDGVPVEATEVWINEGLQGRADLIEMLKGVGLTTALLDLAALHQKDHSVVATMASHRERGVQALVCDAESNADLIRLAALSTSIDGVFWVGSAGLGEHLPVALGLEGTQRTTSSLVAIPRTLIVIGSMSSASHRQADRLLESVDSLALVEIDASELGKDASESVFQSLRIRIDNAFAQKHNVMVRLRQSEDRDATAGPALSLTLGQILSPYLKRIERLIATGGATARALLTGTGITRLTLIDAPDTGMARLSANTEAGVLEVITKAGGFGDDDAFLHIWQRQSCQH